MSKKDYTKFSDNSNNTEKEKLIEEQLKLMVDEPVIEDNNDQHVVSPELEATVLKAGGEVMRADNTDSIQNNDPENIEPELPEVDEPEVDEPEVDEPEVDEPEVDEPEADKDHTGDICPAKVIGCTKLNVRKGPSKDSEVVCIVTDKSTITVSKDLSTEDFYKVYTSVNDVLFEGYCMRQFISIE